MCLHDQQITALIHNTVEPKRVLVKQALLTCYLAIYYRIAHLGRWTQNKLESVGAEKRREIGDDTLVTRHCRRRWLLYTTTT